MLLHQISGDPAKDACYYCQKVQLKTNGKYAQNMSGTCKKHARNIHRNVQNQTNMHV